MSSSADHDLHGEVIARPTPGRALVQLTDQRRVVLDVDQTLEARVRAGSRVVVTLSGSGAVVSWRPALAARR